MLECARKANNRFLPVLILALFFIPSELAADVVFLDDGTILFAEFSSASADELVYKNSTGEIPIKRDRVLRTVPDFSSVVGTDVRLVMKDQTVILGTFIDYDEEIGYFIDLSFGTLTVPLSEVVRMEDPVRTRTYAGSSITVSARSVGYIPLWNDNFSYLVGGGVGGDFKIPLMRGLFAGLDADFIKAQNDRIDDISCVFLQFTPRLTYRHLRFRTGSGFLSRIVPFISVGGGVTAVFVKDLRDGVAQDNYGAFSPHLRQDAGLDFMISENWLLKLNGSFMTIFQKTEPFNAAGGSLSVGYAF